MTNVSKITVNGNDYDIKDTEARSGLSNKQDTLVSGTNIKTINGNSLLGSGDLTVGGSVDIDEETITENGDNELQVVAVKNKRDDSTLGIWHGTEYQWNHGAPTTWYYWQTSATALWTSGGNIPTGLSWISIAYGDGRFVAVNFNNKLSAYSTDGGVTWQSGGDLPSTGYWINVTNGDGKFVAVTMNNTNSAYSTDGGVTWQSGGSLPSSAMWQCMAYGDGRFVVVATSNNVSAYSTDGGVTWQSGGSLPANKNWVSMAYGDGRFVVIDNSGQTAYSTDGGVTWQSGENLRKSGQSIAYGNGRFVIVRSSDAEESFYSTDGGVTWQSGGSLPTISSGNARYMAYGDGKFVAVTYNSDASAYSTDGGVTWQSGGSLPNSRMWQSIAYGDGRFVVVDFNSTNTAIFTVQNGKCYTDTANPTTTSVVYSEPETVSSYTISSVTSGAITLSNNNTYYYNQSGNVQTYDTIGNTHPEYLCFIDGVGIKKGNTLIASATPITTIITSSSTDSEVPSAKAVYDEIGDVESALNTINSGS